MGDVATAIFREISSLPKTSDAVVALHGASDRAWSSPESRGSGLCFNAAGRDVVARACRNVAERLAASRGATVASDSSDSTLESSSNED